MSEMRTLCPTVLDETIYAKCKVAMDRWSAGRAFSLTKTLGTDATITKAVMYHAYEFRLDSKWTHRAFALEDSGTPVAHPKDIESYDLWSTDLHGLDEDCHLELGDTCYKTECEKCDGEGKYTCTTCHGDRKVTCDKCDGSGNVRCRKCGGGGEVRCPGADGLFHNGRDGHTPCPKCHGTNKITCPECHGRGEVRCKKCGGRGEVKCETCDGSGIETCSKCDGRGWNPHVWYLTQAQKSDAVSHLWFDEGIADGRETKDYASYPTESLINDEKDDGSRTQQNLAMPFEAPFAEELKSLWADSDAKLEMAAGEREADKFRYQHAVLKQYDAVIRVEYIYKDKPYIIWVDLNGDRVYEGPDGGLMAEWAKDVAEGGDKAAAVGNTPDALYKYTMSCAITDKDTEISVRANKYLNRQAWYFRLSAALTLLIWWGGFYWRTMGGDAIKGAFFAVGLYLLGDWLILRRKCWMSSLGQVLVFIAGYMGYAINVGDSAIDLDMTLPSRGFAFGCSLSFGALVLLLAHDYALRFRYKKVPHKWIMVALGGLVGWATSPAIAFGCSQDMTHFGDLALALGWGLVVIAACRTMSRFRIIDCGKWIDKIKKPEKKRAFVNSFAELKPAWLMKAVFIILLVWLPLSIMLCLYQDTETDTSSQGVTAGDSTSELR